MDIENTENVPGLETFESRSAISSGWTKTMPEEGKTVICPQRHRISHEKDVEVERIAAMRPRDGESFEGSCRVLP